MAGGQAIDLAKTDVPPDLTQLTELHALKTGQLIIASVQLGAISAGMHATDNHWQKLTALGEHVGLAFQIRDDMLDVVTPPETLGKPQGLDLTNGKYTFVDLLGMDGCQQQLKDLAARAHQCLDGYQDNARLLYELIDFTVNREY
jgi:farnesyl diphosphate synthase